MRKQKKNGGICGVQSANFTDFPMQQGCDARHKNLPNCRSNAKYFISNSRSILFYLNYLNKIIKNLADHIPAMAETLKRVQPKHHWLWHHAPAFLRRHYWWALVSEQCIEHIHSKLNNLVWIFLFKILFFGYFSVASLPKSRRKAQNSAQIGGIPVDAERASRFWTG